MTETNQALREDIAFLRDLAEAGRDRPMLGGAIMLASGAIFGVASLAIWWMTTRLGMTGLVYVVVWTGAFLVFMATLFPLLRGLPKTAGTLQAATGVAWSGMGWAITFLVLSLGVVAFRSGRGDLMFALPALLTALYGGAWWVAGTLLRRPWLMLVAFASFGMALVNAWFAADGDAVWLPYAASLFGLLALPGAVLMRQARRAA